MNIGMGDVAGMLLLLLSSHWPVLVAGIGTLLYGRTLKSRGKFFVASWILGYGVHGLVSVLWPLIWMMVLHKRGATDEFAVFVVVVYGGAAVSALLTFWAIRVIALKYWGRLYP